MSLDTAFPGKALLERLAPWTGGVSSLPVASCCWGRSGMGKGATTPSSQIIPCLQARQTRVLWASTPLWPQDRPLAWSCLLTVLRAPNLRVMGPSAHSIPSLILVGFRAVSAVPSFGCPPSQP